MYMHTHATRMHAHNHKPRLQLLKVQQRYDLQVHRQLILLYRAADII